MISFRIRGASGTYMMGLNDSLWVAGYYTDSLGNHGFIFRHKDTILFNYPGAVNTYLYDINNAGIAVGAYNNGSAGTNVGFKYNIHNQNLTVITSWLPGNAQQVIPYKINNNADVIGSYRVGSNNWIFTMFGSTNTGSIHYGVNPSYGIGLDNLQDLVGYYISGGQYISIIRTNTGATTTFTYPSGIKTKAYGINDYNIIVGEFNSTHGFIYQASNPSSFQELLLPGVTELHPYDINNKRNITGYYRDSAGAMVGFIIMDYDIKFRPYTDGWNFKNNKQNLWPESWYKQFNYQWDPYLKNFTPFPQFVDNWENKTFSSYVFPDWPLWVSCFGKDSCYKTVNGVTILRDEAFQKWSHLIVKNKGKWNGSCFGLSMSSLMLFDNPSAFTAALNRTEPIVPGTHTYYLALDDDFRKAINRLHIMQCVTAYVNFQNLVSKDSPGLTLSKVKSMCLKPGGAEQAVAIQKQNDDEGRSHCMVPYKVVQDEDSLDIEYIYVYDCNFPGDPTRRIKINTTKNRWYYKASETAAGTPEEWGGQKAGGLTIEMPINQLYSLIPPESSPGSPPAKTSNILCFLCTANEAYFKNPACGTAGMQGGALVNTISNALPLLSHDFNSTEPYGYYLPADAYSVRLGDFQDSISQAAFFLSGNSYSFLRFNALPGQHDRLTYSNGLSLVNPDIIEKNVSLTYTTPDATGKGYFITGCNIYQNDSLTISGQPNEELLLTNNGNAKYYNLKIRMVSDSSVAIFQHDSIPCHADVSHRISPAWGNLATGTLMIYVDSLMDGSIDDTLIFNNQAAPALATSAGTIFAGSSSVTDTIYVINSGGGILNWKAHSHVDWINTGTDTAGINTGSVRVSIDSNNAGFRQGYILFLATGAENPSDTVWIGQDGILSAPTVTASDGIYDDKIAITVHPLTNANAWMIYRSFSSVDTGIAITGWISDTTFFDMTTSAGQICYYRARAAADVSGLNASGAGKYDPGWKNCMNPGLGHDTTIFAGQSLTLSPGSGWTTYRWSNGSSDSILIVDTLHFPLGNNQLWVQVTNPDQGCIAIDSIRVQIVVSAGQVGGKIYYDNTPNTNLDSVVVILLKNGAIVQQTFSDSQGNYHFSGLSSGNYTIQCQINKSWGGVNAVDALLIMKHFAGVTNLTGLRLAAADVNGNGQVNSVDALLVAKRYVNLITSFIVGDWKFEDTSLLISGEIQLTSDIKGICFGDVNGSYFP